MHGIPTAHLDSRGEVDLDAAVSSIMVAGFACAGRWGTSTRIVLVHGEVYAQPAEKLASWRDVSRANDSLEDSMDREPVAGSAQIARLTQADTPAGAVAGRPIAGGWCSAFGVALHHRSLQA
jgi:acyl-CoA reductase-like NAD-dependent aldehyde dehydrogenase